MSSEGRAVKQAKSVVQDNLENMSDKSATLKEKVSDNISNISDKIHQGADSGKTFLNDRTEQANVLAQQAFDKASEAVSNSSEYIKNFDLEGTKESVKSAVKENPEILLITVGILGLAVGYLLGKRNV